MKDLYVMDKQTGELIPATVAIREFYKTHGILESWIEYYEETKIECDTEIEFPDFCNVLA